MTAVEVGTGAWIRQFRQPGQGASAAGRRPAAQPAIRLVCFPHAGGSASFYAPFARSLHADMDVVAVQYPGRQDRRDDKPIEDITELADRIFEVLRPGTGQPLAFFGHSMGALVAYEVARRLEQQTNTTLSAFFASAKCAPLRRPRQTAVRMSDDDDVLAELARLGGTDMAALLDNRELVRMILPPIRSDYRALQRYVHRPGPMLACPITVLIGDADPQVTLDEAGAWREHTAGDFAMRVFPGGHFFLSAQQAQVSEVIRAQLCAHS